MKFVKRFMFVLVAAALALVALPMPSTAGEVPWAPECWDCPVTNYGDPDGGNGTLMGTGRTDATAYRRVGSVGHGGSQWLTLRAAALQLFIQWKWLRWR